MLAEQEKQIVCWIRAAAMPLLAGAELGPVTLERPKSAEHGDLACNIALQLAKSLGQNARELAQAIISALDANPSAKALIETATLAGPGFINLRVTAAAKQAVVRMIARDGERFGHSDRGGGQPVLIEFVSANPTGPLHVGHGRQAALGDALAALLSTQGFVPTREFYYNDAGVQIGNLAASVSARLAALTPNDPGWPQEAYNGEYVSDIAREFLARSTVVSDDRTYTASGDIADLASIRQFAVAYLRREQDLDLRAFGVAFDHYFLESSLYSNGKVKDVVDALVATGKTYELDGALWLRSTEFGDDKDRVMRKSDHTYTYFVPDVAYHVNKWQRGYQKAINIQGSDHHGTIARVRAGLQALDIGIAPGYPAYLLHKMVRVVRGGQEVKISKRAGSYVTLRELIDWVGKDAVRFFLASRKPDTEFTFDVDLALAQSEDNPVYYVQYAHARISSVLAQWRERDGGEETELEVADLSLLISPREGRLLQRLSEFPEVLALAAAEMAPHQLAFYLKECASDLHSYYNAERILVEDTAAKKARLALLVATRQVLRNGLALLGVSAPEKM